MKVFKSKKNLNVKLVQDLAKGLSLDPAEQRYLEILVKYTNENSEKEKQILEMVLAEIRQLTGIKAIVEDSNIFSHWVHMAILTFSKIESVPCTRETISAHLMDSVSFEIIDESISRLLRLGLIKYVDGSLRREQGHTTSKNDTHRFSPHNYFEQTSDLAKRGAQSPMEEREFQSFSLAIKHNQIPMFKDMIRSFRAKVAEIADSEDSDQVYQFNIQFFPLIKKVNKIQSPENDKNMISLQEVTAGNGL